MMDKDSKDKVLFPTVLWGQRGHMVLIRVQIQPLVKPDFNIRESHMDFKGLGIGLSGKALYKFELVFYEPVDTEKCRVKFSEKEVEFRLLKKEGELVVSGTRVVVKKTSYSLKPSNQLLDSLITIDSLCASRALSAIWPRLQSAHERPHWLRVDFELFEDQEESDEEEKPEGSKVEEMELERKEQLAKTKAQLDELESAIKQQKKTYDTIMKYLELLKTVYLLAYNGIQWAGFILIVMTLVMKCLMKEGIHTAYDNTASMMMFCQGLALLEIGHAMLGLVKSGITAIGLQVLGRFLVLFVVLMPAEEIHQHPVVFVLFFVWSLVELFRYPYYALAVLGREVDELTWLRYTVWIPLYPVGFTCEATTVWLSIPHFEKSGDWYYALPNPLNVSFYPPAVMRVALFIVPIIAFSLISHMAKQRKKKLAKLKIP